MAEQQRRRESSPRLRPGGPPQRSSSAAAAARLAGDAGARRPRRPGLPSRRRGRTSARWLVVLVIGLLALNFWISSQALSPSPRVQVPYSPTFLTQVRTTTSSRSPRPGTRSTGRSRRRSSTRPTAEQLTTLLLHPDPVVRRTTSSCSRCSRRTTSRSTPSRRTQGPSFLTEPDLRLRADAAARAAVRVADAPSGGRRRRRRRADVVRPLPRPPRRGAGPARHVRRRGRDRRGQGGADRDRRLPQEPGQVPAARRPDPARRAAERRRPGPARRCSRGRSPARRACRSSRCRRRSSSR